MIKFDALLVRLDQDLILISFPVSSGPVASFLDDMVVFDSVSHLFHLLLCPPTRYGSIQSRYVLSFLALDLSLMDSNPSWTCKFLEIEVVYVEIQDRASGWVEPSSESVVRPVRRSSWALHSPTLMRSIRFDRAIGRTFTLSLPEKRLESSDPI